MKDTNINSSRLKEFCDTIIMQAREVLYEREADILKAWHENIEEAQASGKDFPPLKLGIGATVDLEGNTIETTLRFTAVYQSKLSTDIPDPDQAELPGISREDTLKSAVKEAAMSGKLAKGLLSKKHGITSVAIAVDGETIYDSRKDEDDHDGPRIMDAEEEGELGPVGFRDLAGHEINALLTTFEGVPKNQRKKRLAELLAVHGPANIRKFDEYRTWGDADLHVVKVIQECINGLTESQPEGASDDY